MLQFSTSVPKIFWTLLTSMQIIICGKSKARQEVKRLNENEAKKLAQTSGKFPNSDINFCDNKKLCTASEYSLANMIDSSWLDLLGSCHIHSDSYEEN